MLRTIAAVLAVFMLSSLPLPAQTRAAAGSSSHAKVRAITAFVHLDRAQYQQQIAGALAVLRKLKAGFEADAYEVDHTRDHATSVRARRRSVGGRCAQIPRPIGSAFRQGGLPPQCWPRDDARQRQSGHASPA